MALLDYGGSSALSTQLQLAAASIAITFGIIAVLHWVSHLAVLPLPEVWVRLRQSENLALYRSLGVVLFRSALLASPLRVLNKNIVVTSRSDEALVRLHQHMRNAEANHLIAFLLTAAATATYGRFTDPGLVPWLIVTNLLGNGYPTLLQRYNRLRLDPLIHRSRRRRAALSSGE